MDNRSRVCLAPVSDAAGGWLWELPAGKLEPGETPFNTVRRELAEEAGVAADQWADPIHERMGPRINANER